MSYLHCSTCHLYLLKRGYNRNFVNKQIRRAADIPRQLTLQTKDINNPKRIPFITTFNPSLPHIPHIIKKHFNLLLSSNRCKSLFQHPPVVAFRRSPNLRVLLITAKLPSNSANPQLLCGSFRCGKNCATCPYISHGLTTYTFFSNGETRPIKFNLTCETKNLIYMIQCNRCNLQYIGEMKRRLKDRFNEHRRAIDNPNNKSNPTTAAEHFLSSVVTKRRNDLQAPKTTYNHLEKFNNHLQPPQEHLYNHPQTIEYYLKQAVNV